MRTGRFDCGYTKQNIVHYSNSVLFPYSLWHQWGCRHSEKGNLLLVYFQVHNLQYMAVGRIEAVDYMISVLQAGTYRTK